MSTEEASAKKRFGRYEIHSLLGKGGMAEVFRARICEGQNEGWPVAVKRLDPKLAADPEVVAQFTREGALSRMLDHPNIVKVLDVGVFGGVRFIAMELVDGRDLSAVLRRCKARGIPLPIDFAVFLAKTLLDALSFAHEAKDAEGRPLGVVHCDVSPSNLFISRTGEIKLGDFGVARGIMASQSDVAVHGKPYYVSPEALENEITPQVDLWAAAVTLYELLTSERPFTGENPDEVFAAIRALRYVPPKWRRPELSQELCDVLDKAFSEKQSERFATAAEFAQALVPHFDPNVGTPLAIAAVVRGLFGAGQG